MSTLPDKLKEFSELLDQQRPREAFVLFLEQTHSKSWYQLLTSDLSMLDVLCQQTLLELRERQTLWMVNHPDRLRRMLKLLTDALAVGYRRAVVVDHIAWLRCLLAIAEAMTGRIERVHEELCLVSGPENVSIPEPNGILRQQIQSIQLTERSAAEFLKLFFAAYLEFLRRVGQYELANHIENRVGRLLGHIARDENRPGVVQALFYDKSRRLGHCGFVHVSLERQSGSGDQTQPPEAINYARPKQDVIDAAMKEAADYARQAVDTYLKRTGYPDGLDGRLVRWEIATVQGDAVKLQPQFQGGSIALPLAVAIVSEYIARPVSNDAAFTGGFSSVSTADGEILPVDGVPEKVEQAAVSGCRFIHIPTANFRELNSHPALRNLVSENNARIITVETLDQVCKELFPPEGSGELLDAVKDTAANFLEILNPVSYPLRQVLAKPAHQRHRTYVIICSILTAALVFLEGLRLYRAFAPQYSAFAAGSRIIASTAVVFIGMVLSFALPAACLRHRKAWSWYAGIGILAVCFCAGIFLLGPMLPDFIHISDIYNLPPFSGLIKDMFIMWLFAWGLAANTFNAVAALEDLIAKRQFVTAGVCLQWDSPLEGRMPLRCIHFSWMWGTLAIGAFAAYLIGWEINYYGTVDTSTNAGYWETLLGFVRDLLFGAAVIYVLIFYKNAVARIRTALR